MPQLKQRNPLYSEFRNSKSSSRQFVFGLDSSSSHSTSSPKNYKNHQQLRMYEQSTHDFDLILISFFTPNNTMFILVTTIQFFFCNGYFNSFNRSQENKMGNYNTCREAMTAAAKTRHVVTLPRQPPPAPIRTPQTMTLT